MYMLLILVINIINQVQYLLLTIFFEMTVILYTQGCRARKWGSQV